MPERIIHRTTPFTWAADAGGAYVRALLWEKSRRAPVTIELDVSRAELVAMVREIDRAREEVDQPFPWHG